MAGTNMGQGGGRGSGRLRRHRPIAEINVTPMVDVMLVLLVIFMVAAPMLTVGVEVDLPKTEAGPLPVEPEEPPLTLTLTADGALVLQDEAVPPAELVRRLRAVIAERRSKRIYLRADGAIPYGQVMKLMGALDAAGFHDLALVTAQEGPEEHKGSGAGSGGPASTEAVEGEPIRNGERPQ